MLEDSWEWGWQVPSHLWPLLVAIFCGGALFLLLVLTAVLWHFCVAPHRNKDYSVRMDRGTLSQRHEVPVLPSHSAVFVEPFREWIYSSQLVTSRHWFYNKHLIANTNCNVPRSLSVPTSAPVETRRHFTPSRFIISDTGPSSLPVPLPHISEFSPGTHYVSSSILDDWRSRNLYPSIGGVMLKTQSLPTSVRSCHRPVSTTEYPFELYAKANFSKKRKNRMRNNEAAIIALSKSRSQFLNKDTDSLVDNEAVIIYNERTAL